MSCSYETRGLVSVQESELAPQTICQVLDLHTNISIVNKLIRTQHANVHKTYFPVSLHSASLILSVITLFGDEI